MKKNTDVATQERKIFIAKNAPPPVREEYWPAWPVYLVSASIAGYAVLVLYVLFS